MRTRWAIVALAVVVAIVVAVVVWPATRPTPYRPRRTRSARLDFGAFRALADVRVQRARAIAPDPRPAAPRHAAGAGAGSMMGRGAMPHATTQLLEPCTLGPRELCNVLAPLATACDGGDAASCLAVGQFLGDTPPRGLVAIFFFVQACRIGDPEGCARVDQLRSDADVPCADDPLACGYRAQRTNDDALHDEACADGVADSCAVLAFRLDEANESPDESRTYLEAACQLGSPMACQGLAARLMPGCVPAEASPCYPPDPVQAATASEIGCAAGWCSR